MREISPFVNSIVFTGLLFSWCFCLHLTSNIYHILFIIFKNWKHATFSLGDISKSTNIDSQFAFGQRQKVTDRFHGNNTVFRVREVKVLSIHHYMSVFPFSPSCDKNEYLCGIFWGGNISMMRIIGAVCVNQTLYK